METSRGIRAEPPGCRPDGSGHRIERRGRFVAEQRVRRTGQGPGDGHALLLAAVERAGPGVGLVREP